MSKKKRFPRSPARDLLLVGKKHCPTCDTVKSTSEFYPDPHKLSGFATQCRGCSYKSNRASLKKHRLHAEQLLSPNHACMHPGCGAKISLVTRTGKVWPLEFAHIKGRPHKCPPDWWIYAYQDNPEEFQKTTLLFCREHHLQHDRCTQPHRDIVAEKAEKEDLRARLEKAEARLAQRKRQKSSQPTPHEQPQLTLFR